MKNIERVNKLIIFSLIIIFYGCDTPSKDSSDKNKSLKNEDFIYSKDVTNTNYVDLNEDIIIKSTLSDHTFLQEAKTKGYNGLIEGKIKNRSNDLIEVKVVDKWISNDTLNHKINLKAKSDIDDSTKFIYEVEVQLDIDERNYYDKVDTIFPYVNSIRVKK